MSETSQIRCRDDTVPKTVYTRSHCKVWLGACNNLPQPPPYISVFWGCGRLLHALNHTLQWLLVSTVFGTVSSLHLISIFTVVMNVLYTLVPKCTVPSGAPRNFTAFATSPFEAAFSWVPPPADEQNGIIANYVINITEDNTGEEFQVSTSNTSLTIDDNLQPYYTYICVIAAETSVGEGPFSSNISFTTHEYGRLQ